MSHDEHSLERELAMLQPRPPSGELQQRLAAELTVRPSARQRGPRTWLAIAAASGLALAALIAVVIARRPAEEVRPSWEGAEMDVALFDGSLPSVWAYRRAIVNPDIDVEMLLDQHRGAGTGPDLTSGSAFSVSSFHQQSWTGEL